MSFSNNPKRLLRKPQMIKKLITFLVLTFAVVFFSTKAKAENAQISCLAKAMYFEARGGDSNEMINIGNAIINRTGHKAFPKTVCGVIADRKHACQFPWYCRGLSVKDQSTFNRIKELAESLYLSEKQGKRIDTVNGAVFFHARSINPGWKYKKVSVNDTLHRYYRT